MACLHCTGVGTMADNQVQQRIPVEDNIDWVADDPRTMPSKFEFEEEFPEDLFTDIEDCDHVNWDVRIPGARQRICSTFRNGGFPMYQITFEHMGLRFPFSDLEVAIFNHLELCPSQLHPNSLAFIRAFEIVAAYLQLAPTIPMFFHLFGIQCSRPRGNMTDKCGWAGRPLVSGPDGPPIEVDCGRFPFCWSTKHYSREAKSFTFMKGALSKEELVDVKALEDFVDGFPANLWEDKEGNPIYDENGRWMTSKKFINTKALLKCETRVKAEALLYMQIRRGGRQVVLRPRFSAASSPSLSIEVTGEKKGPGETIVEQRPPKSARTGGGECSGLGPHKLMPGRAAAEFIIPPAMGHECLLDGKTSAKISEADQSILASMSPESIKNVVAESSVAVFKLLEVATFLNGRECKYLKQRDEARAHAKYFGARLTQVEEDLSSKTKAFEDSRAKVVKLEKDLKDAKEEEKKLKERVAELEGQVASLSLAPMVEEEEKKLDPEGTYAQFSRADLIARIYQIGDMQLEVASSSFKNALAQLRILNPDVQLVTNGMDELKEVWDGQIATPPLDEE
ncbi:hypothetical protein TSUD_374460 [Trifolium subterraneum]|uniref:Transposase (putative) gypsy type domain-containing protein n=1 Tax=Trifolium subterraneum TaxID=3900 RepID=A0A2Z6PKG3_TRISU|nr:hypothetical protein TSUD_374460 [Trifolium subterraneum]